MEHLMKLCALDEVENLDPENEFKLLPCQHKFDLKTEDVISLDSIFSAVMAPIAPSIESDEVCDWGITAKDELNDKQALLFTEKLYISTICDGFCNFKDENKIILEKQLQEIGEFSLKIEESYDGYVVFCKSKMVKDDKCKMTCGHSLKGKYDEKFVLICEKRMEYDYVDHARVEKTLEARMKGDKLIAIRETKINEVSQKFKAVVNVKGRDNCVVLDGGIMILMRHLIVNNFVGEFEYYSMNLFGKIVRGNIYVRAERKRVRIFYKTYAHAVSVTNTQYFNGVAQDVSEAYYTSSGQLILHMWLNYNYIMHATKSPYKPTECILPKFELMWKCDNALFKEYNSETRLSYENALHYLDKHPELTDFIFDYILSLLKYKPANVLQFSIKFFQNMKSRV